MNIHVQKFTDFEDMVIKLVVPECGIPYCAKLLGNRTTQQVYARAQALKVHHPNNRTARGGEDARSMFYREWRAARSVRCAEQGVELARQLLPRAEALLEQARGQYQKVCTRARRLGSLDTGRRAHTHARNAA